MKAFFKITSVLFMAMAVTVSCSDDDDPADNDLFVGTYDGTVGYSDEDSGTNVVTQEGSVTVVKVGEDYRFEFSNDIPALTGLDMEKDQNVLVRVGQDGTGVVRIDAGNLEIDFTRGGERWTADGIR